MAFAKYISTASPTRFTGDITLTLSPEEALFLMALVGGTRWSAISSSIFNAFQELPNGKAIADGEEYASTKKELYP